MKKWLVAITLFFFSTSEFSWAAQELHFPLIHSNSELSVGNPFRLEILPDMGNVEFLVSGSGPAVVHIQEAHGHYEVQKKIQALLQTLKDQYGFNTLLVEGGAFKLHPERVRLFPDRMDITHEVLDELAKEGIAKGDELFLADSPDTQAYGIENVEAYIANGQAFREVIIQQEKTGGVLKSLNVQIERLTSAYLNQNLRHFLKRLEDYEAGLIPFEEWLNVIKKEAKEMLELDLTDPRNQIDWPMLLRIFKLKEIEAKLNLQKFEKEREEFLSEVTRHQAPDTRKQIKELLSTPISQSVPTDIEILIEQMVSRLPKDFNYQAYPNVNLFIGHLILQSEIKGDRLMNEVEALEEKISTKFTRAEEEKQLLGLLSNYRLLKKLFLLELTPSQYAVLSAQYSSKPSKLIHQFTAINKSNRVRNLEFQHLDEIDALYVKAMEFYSWAKKRDEIMIQNVVARMKELKTTKAVVITGGFHSQPFKEYFTKEGYNYALVTPTITTTEDRKKYIQSILKYQLQPSDSSQATLRIPELLASTRSELRQLGFDGELVRRQIRAILRVREKFESLAGSFKRRETLFENPQVILGGDSRKDFSDESHFHFKMPYSLFDVRHGNFYAFKAVVNALEFFSKNFKLASEVFQKDSRFAFFGKLWTFFVSHIWTPLDQGMRILRQKADNVNIENNQIYIGDNTSSLSFATDHGGRSEVRLPPPDRQAGANEAGHTNHQENRRWPSLERIMSPLMSSWRTLARNFSTETIISSAYGGWIWMRMMVNVSGGYIAELVKSLSSVIRIRPSFFDWRAISESGAEELTRMASWPNRVSVFSNLTGISSSIRNFMQRVSLIFQTGSILDFSRIEQRNEGRPEHDRVSIQGNNLSQQFLQALSRLQGVLAPHKLEFAFAENMVFHAGPVGLPKYIGQLKHPSLNSPLDKMKNNIPPAEGQGVSGRRSEVRGKLESAEQAFINYFDNHTQEFDGGVRLSRDEVLRRLIFASNIAKVARGGVGDFLQRQWQQLLKNPDELFRELSEVMQIFYLSEDLSEPIIQELNGLEYKPTFSLAKAILYDSNGDYRGDEQELIDVLLGSIRVFLEVYNQRAIEDVYDEEAQEKLSKAIIQRIKGGEIKRDFDAIQDYLKDLLGGAGEDLDLTSFIHEIMRASFPSSSDEASNARSGRNLNDSGTSLGPDALRSEVRTESSRQKEKEAFVHLLQHRGFTQRQAIIIEEQVLHAVDRLEDPQFHSQNVQKLIQRIYPFKVGNSASSPNKGPQQNIFIANKMDLTLQEFYLTVNHAIANSFFNPRLYLQEAYAHLRVLEDGISIPQTVKNSISGTQVILDLYQKSHFSLDGFLDDLQQKAKVEDEFQNLQPYRGMSYGWNWLLYQLNRFHAEPSWSYVYGRRVGETLYILTRGNFEKAYQMLRALNEGQNLEEIFWEVADLDQIIEYNIRQVGSEAFNGVWRRESIGGNAGRGYRAVNGIVDRTGRIVGWGNYQNLDSGIQKQIDSGQLTGFGLRVRVPQTQDEIVHFDFYLKKGVLIKDQESDEQKNARRQLYQKLSSILQATVLELNRRPNSRSEVRSEVSEELNVKNKEWVQQKVLQIFRSGIVALALIGKYGQAELLKLLTDLGIIETAQAAETINVEAIRRAKSILGIRAEQVNESGYVLAVGPQLAVDYGMLDALRYIFGKGPMAVIIPSADKVRRNVVETYRKSLFESEHSDLFIAENAEEANEFLNQALANSKNSGHQRMLLGLVTPGDEGILGEALKEDLNHFIIMTRMMLNQFSQIPAIEALIQGFMQKFEVDQKLAAAA